MNILGIETSCDETGIALYDSEKGLLGHALHSQVDLHQVYGGAQLHVVPVVTGTDHNGVFVSCNVETLSWLAAPWKLFGAMCGVSNLDLG